MTKEQALSLKPGDKVRLIYTPAPGHGPKINAALTIKSVGPDTGRDYVWVSFKPKLSIPGSESVYSSKFIERIKP